MKKIAILLVTCLVLVSCKSDDEATSEPTLSNLTLDFKNTIENTPIGLGTSTYTNGSAENYTISELKYIISNIVLIDANGGEFKYPVDQSYFLVNEGEEASKNISLADIPSGTYTKIRFGVGVDQSKYPLDGMANFVPTAEEAGMLWSWSAGYKFIKFEGAFGDADTPFLIHVGSHGSVLDNYKEVTLDLSSSLTLSPDSELSKVEISADIAKIFDSTNTHSLVEKSDVQVDPVSEFIAENINTMFTVTEVSN